MLLLLLVCLMKFVEMSSSSKLRKCGTKENQPEYYKNLQNQRGTKVYGGMTEHPNHKSWLPQFYSQQKRPLTNTNFVFNQLNNGINCQNQNDYTDFEKALDYKYNELTEENLKNNVQIVLNNINRNYNALKKFILNEKVNNNNIKGGFNMISSPESDCNSNMGPLGCSIASSQDFSHDNFDYQWFLDYGYRDGVTHQSVLSSLSSYNGLGELSYYDDFAKNIDANLAEVDMESFRAEDIHSLLTTLPSLCKENNKRRKESELDNSICKSEILFSPVKESHISVDSLDLDGYPDDGDIILTCQANKNNYTIAFEGSTVYSDDSFYDGSDINGKLKQNSINMMRIDDIVKKKSLEVSMTRSETGLTTWSKLKKSSTSQLQRYPSGNNNSSMNVMMTHHTPTCFVRKSSSMPNLRLLQNNQLNVSQAISNSTVDSYGKIRTLLPMCPMPISSSESESPNQLQNSNISNGPIQNPPSFNLVKLFIKQKSSSSDTCMDVSSGCWPSDSSSSNEQKMRKKSMNDSGKGSALSRHDEDIETSFQYDSLDVVQSSENNMRHTTNNERSRSNDLYREVFDSPSHRNYKECNLNIRNHARPNALFNLNNNNNNSIERDSLKETNKSLSDTSRTSENITQIYSKTRIPLDMITKSIQTSFISKDKLNLVPPSFLAKLNKFGDKQKAPVYVIYPNYTLPNLDFIKSHSEVILSPLGYKESFQKKQRPYSCTDGENMKQNEYNHVIDWKSLVTLLPNNYKKILKHIPEVNSENDDNLSQRPMFCMTPPLKRSRQMSCDCASYINTCTSSSGSSQPPSSGYRGSSTMLTDSELENTGNNNDIKNMYVYQYENSEVGAERPPSGRTPRSILRRSNSKTKNKRNSMFDEAQFAGHNFEKRRSVQDPYYMAEGHNIIADYIAESEDTEITEQMAMRGYAHNGNKLPNRQHNPEYKDDYNSRLNKAHLNTPEFSELEINKALNNRINRAHLENQMNVTYNREPMDLEARIRAENFLSNVPKSELKYYAEIANILESMDNNSDIYDRIKLKNEVSRALSKKVSFNNQNYNHNNTENPNYLGTGKMFTTPPNSPNISVAASRLENKDKQSDREKQEKINSNRFKRLQIQWELLSKDSFGLSKEFSEETILEVKSGGSTPTSGMPPKSRIPRPVSYPATKTTTDSVKNLRSPSRLVAPKKYNSPVITPTPQITTKTTNKLNTTPKKTAPLSRPNSTRTR